MKTIQTYHPEMLLVTRDGFVDDEYYDVLYEQRRKDAIHAAGRELIHFTLVTAPVSVGKGMLYLLSTLAEQAK